MALTPRQPPYRYQAFITVGRLDEIRNAFNRLAADPKILPPALTKDIAQYLKSPEELVEGQPDLGRHDMQGRLLAEDDDGLAAGATAAAAADGGGSDDSRGVVPQQGAPASGLEGDVLTRAGAGAASGGLLKVGEAAGDGDDSSAGEKQKAMKIVAAVVAAVGGVALVGVGVAAAAVQKVRAQRRAAAAYSQQEGAAGAEEPAAAAGGAGNKGEALVGEAVLGDDGDEAAGPRSAAAVVE